MKLTALLLFACCWMGRAYAQLSDEDLALIGKEDFYHAEDFARYTGEHNNADFLHTKKNTFLSRYNPASLAMGGVMYTYQHVVSPLLSRSCPYEITCSNFAKLSIHDWGLVKGVFIAADRVLRCNRISVMDTSPLNIDLSGKIIDDPARY